MGRPLPAHLDEIVQAQKRGEERGIPGICSAHPYVLRAAIKRAVRHPSPVLIEATCNQVNQYGGYTGMTPSAFVAFIRGIAEQENLPMDLLILGGDHLGPSVWQTAPAERAMEDAETLVRDYVQAGFTKIHLDASMPLGGEDASSPLDVDLVARRAARLARAAEDAAAGEKDASGLRYVIGTEVPIPGGAREHDEHVIVTSAGAIRETIEATRQAFEREGLQNAWERVVALVVQPGVDFGDEFILDYNPVKSRDLVRFIEDSPLLVYEAHSTDYQQVEALREMVRDHFAILKVGPALTFAFREMVFALVRMEEELYTGVRSAERSHLIEVLDQAMLGDPRHWQTHYRGSSEQEALARRYSLSDRVRYYWPNPHVQEALKRLVVNLQSVQVPLALLSQYAPGQFARVRAGRLGNRPEEWIRDRIDSVLGYYAAACGGKPA
jgi:D-tagatose-1,6-bisphosphate aldolase subunit GatZ/KbaZ